MPADSTVNQLTYLYNTICKALDQGKEVRAVFCDIRKPLTVYGMLDISTKCRQLEFVAQFLTGSKLSFKQKAKSCTSRHNIRLFLNDQFWSFNYSFLHQRHSQ